MSKFTPEQNRAFWDEFAKKSRNNPFGAHSDKHVVELENRFIISELEGIKPATLLDIGCGNGQRTLIFSRYVNQKTLGVDYSQVMIDEANTFLSKQDQTIRNKLSFEISDVQNFSKELRFDTIVSCRCFINQSSYDNQIKLFELLYDKLNTNGSLIIAEQSLEGIERLSSLRNKYGLEPTTIRWYNLPINENIVFSQIEDLFHIKKISRLGIFYYITRVLHPSLVYPNEPDPNAKINDVGTTSEIIFQSELNQTENPFEKFGAQLLIHFIKK